MPVFFAKMLLANNPMFAFKNATAICRYDCVLLCFFKPLGTPSMMTANASLDS